MCSVIFEKILFSLVKNKIYLKSNQRKTIRLFEKKKKLVVTYFCDRYQFLPEFSFNTMACPNMLDRFYVTIIFSSHPDNLDVLKKKTNPKIPICCFVWKLDLKPSVNWRCWSPLLVWCLFNWEVSLQYTRPRSNFKGYPGGLVQQFVKTWMLFNYLTESTMMHIAVCT